MPDFSLGKVYKIIDNTNNRIYVGSTCEPTLARRLAKHVGDYKLYVKSKKHFITSFDIIKNGDYDIILLETFPCQSRDELNARERYYIESLDCVNKIVVGRTDKEYREAYKEKMKAYRLENKEILSEKRKEYIKNNSEEIKLKKKLHREQPDIKEKTKEYNKIYILEKGEEINKKRLTEYKCLCGCIIKKCSKARHEKTKLHEDSINSINLNLI